VKDVHDAFAYLKGASFTFSYGSIGVEGTQAKASSDRQGGAHALSQPKARSRRPCTVGRAKVAMWIPTRGSTLLEC
jgi:hypothetical protein